MDDEFNLQTESAALQEDSENYNIPHEQIVDDYTAILEEAVEAVTDNSEAITDPKTFDVFRSVLKHSQSGSVLGKLFDALHDALDAELNATKNDLGGEQQEYQTHRQPMEMYAFLLKWLVQAAEKVKTVEEQPGSPLKPARRGRGGKTGKAAAKKAATSSDNWTWIDQIPKMLNLVTKVLRVQTLLRLWKTNPERETFINCITAPAYQVAENEQYMKSVDIRNGVYTVICLAVKHHQGAFPAQTAIVQLLQYNEHLSEPMAECLTLLAKQYDHNQLGDEILREVAKMTFTSQDNKGTRSFSKFLAHFAEQSPRSMLKQISLLLGQLDSDAYPMRIAIVEIIGALILDLDAATSDDSSSDSVQLKNQIPGLYDYLLERTMDLSSYVRTKVLSVLSRLCHLKNKYPKQRLAVSKAAVAALKDKSATVRKGAIMLLGSLLLTHPYAGMHGGTLKDDEFTPRYEEVRKEVKKAEKMLGIDVPEEGEDGGEEEGEEDEMDVDGETQEDGEEETQREETQTQTDEMDVDADAGPDAQPKPRKRKKLQRRKSELNFNPETARALLDSNELERLKLLKRYYAEALQFIRTVKLGMELITELLGSTSKPEVLEAIEFLRIVKEYEIDGAETGIKKMLHLIWAKDNTSTSSTTTTEELKGIRSRVLECYRNLYFEPRDGMDRKAQINFVVKNMLEITFEATLAELTSLEEMMRIMMDEGQIEGEIVDKLWQVYHTNKSIPKPQRRGAILILGMLALANRNILEPQVDWMLKIGLGGFGKNDLALARYTCIALQRLNGSAKKVKGSLTDNTIRLDMDHIIFRKLLEAVEVPTLCKEWFALAEQAINTVYALGQRPHVWCETLIKNLTRRVFGKPRRGKAKAAPPVVEEKDPDAMDEDGDGDGDGDVSRSSETPLADAEASSDDMGEVFELSQLLFVVGHVALKHIVFLELVEREWKRQKDESQTAEKNQYADANKSKGGDDLENVVGNAEDEIGERIAAIRESEVLYDPNALLGQYGRMLVHICGSPHKFKNEILRAVAILSFSKFLCVSSQFCDQNHRLLFKLLETSKYENIRSNIVIALGDIAVCFSTIIDENSNELYKGLSDRRLSVKKNTLMVLTHLILNGMIKVKGQLGEMAKCLEDEDRHISDLAKLFFTELSTKDNAIYNNLPDIISHLSVGEHAVEEPVFQSTLKYIFSFIEKEKQAENIVEKLCQRFQMAEEPRQWRDIAYCLSLLPFKSERSVKKLIDGLTFYRDKLHEETVFKLFTEILAKARQNKSANKPDAELDDFERILNEHREQGEADQALEKRVQVKKAAAKKKAMKRDTRSKKTSKQQKASDDDDEE